MGFRLDQDASVGGTSLRGYVELPPCRLIELFGEPFELGDKSTGEYSFVDDDRNVFTVHDFTISRVGGGAWWRSDKPYNFHVGARPDVSIWKFLDWIKAVCAGERDAA